MFTTQMKEGNKISKMSNEPYHAILYQQKMQALYNNTAATIFKEQYFPADPFEGELIDAAFLEISELTNIFKAAKALEDEGNGAFVENLIISRGLYRTPEVRVNSLWSDGLRIRKAKICRYLEQACFGFSSAEEVVFYEQEIADMNDPQLSEYLRQAQEALSCEVEVEVQ